ncbi:MAG TPA: GNAT family N-acetyltransferase [Thermoanaerobaculia bacterium]|nr:GNAT family N-acetyltransferase [Thermoanaerobaculia bacterium]
MAGGFSIRKATEDDALGILACLRSAFEPYRDRYSEAAFVDTVPTLEALRQRARSMCHYVAVTANNEVVGTIACKVLAPDDGHIRGMAVQPGFQGRGVAGELLATVEAELAAAGCTRITLDTVAPLQRAIRFYERRGFRASGKVADFFGMPLFEYVKPAVTPGRAERQRPQPDC